MDDTTKDRLRSILLTPTDANLVRNIPGTPYLYSTWSAQWAEIIHAFPDAELEVRWVEHGEHGVRACVRVTIDGVARENVGYSPNPEYKNPRTRWDGDKKRTVDLTDEERQANLEKMVMQDDGSKAATSDALSRVLAVWGKSLDLYWTGKDAFVWDALYPMLSEGQDAPERPYLSQSSGADDEDGTPSDAPTCPKHNRKMRYWPEKGHLPATWKCTDKVGDGWCDEKVNPNTTERSTGNGKKNGVDSEFKPAPAVVEWRQQAPELYPDIAKMTRERMVAGIKQGEEVLAQHGIEGYGEPEGIETKRREFFGAPTVVSAGLDALRGYYAFLRKRAAGAGANGEDGPGANAS